VSATLITQRGGAAVFSGSAAIPDGARATLLRIPGRFRLDVQSTGDTLRTTVRHLAGGVATLRGPGYAGPVYIATDWEELRPSRYDLTVELKAAGKSEQARVLIGALGDPTTGVTTFTGQAIIATT
jgi:hypothetical protein